MKRAVRRSFAQSLALVLAGLSWPIGAQAIDGGVRGRPLGTEILPSPSGNPRPVGSPLAPLYVEKRSPPAAPAAAPTSPSADSKSHPTIPASPTPPPPTKASTAKVPPQPKVATPKASPTKGVTKSHAAQTTGRREPEAAVDEGLGAESPELRALREAERELFPAPGTEEPNEPSTRPVLPTKPRAQTGGLPPASKVAPAKIATGTRDVGWLSSLVLPDLPIRWDARVVRYLEFFKNDRRGRAMMTLWLRRSGRYRAAMARVLGEKGLPRDLVAVSMIESGFEPTARSHAGAVGLWQFMPETGKAYGLDQSHWLDQRYSVESSTRAASDFLADLHKRLGSWELALAAYNMGYGGLSSVVKRYNTNDFWTLSDLEAALPWETTLYVPKILAASIVARNRGVFGFDEVKEEAPVEPEVINVAGGITLAGVAAAGRCKLTELEALNPELRRGRTPPTTTDGETFPVKVPKGTSRTALEGLAKLPRETAYERYVVRFGETVEQIAAARKLSLARLLEVNGLERGEQVRGGTTLILPHRDGSLTSSDPRVASATATADGKPVVVVPAETFVYPGRERLFYKVAAGDELGTIAKNFRVTVDDLVRWNAVDPNARLHEGMTLQVFAPADLDTRRVVALRTDDVRVLVSGSEEFMEFTEGQKGRVRLRVAARAGETLEGIGHRYGVTAGVMERINHRGRRESLKAGETVLVYVPKGTSANDGGGAAKAKTADLSRHHETPVVSPASDLPEFIVPFRPSAR
jgi:membrane-bound lytic murein transglycosylase D